MTGVSQPHSGALVIVVFVHRALETLASAHELSAVEHRGADRTRRSSTMPCSPRPVANAASLLSPKTPTSIDSRPCWVAGATLDLGQTWTPKSALS
jgi:hypothetical protein